jgi:tRNA (cytidine/uridine-2'-O-)-methyltransferase
MRSGNPPSSGALQIVLFEPEIPPNTGNIIRLAANAGCRVHLVGPLGFSLRDKQLQRAGLDYHARAAVSMHESWKSFRASCDAKRMFAVTTRGERRHDEPRYQAGDAFVFGPETRGLPEEVLAEFAPELRLRIPMLPGSRSLNLSNAAAVVVYEAWRQLGFGGS